MGWERPQCLQSRGCPYFPLHLLELVITAEVRHPTGLGKQSHHKQNQRQRTTEKRPNRRGWMTKLLAPGEAVPRRGKD